MIEYVRVIYVRGKFWMMIFDWRNNLMGVCDVRFNILVWALALDK